MKTTKQWPVVSCGTCQSEECGFGCAGTGVSEGRRAALRLAQPLELLLALLQLLTDGGLLLFGRLAIFLFLRFLLRDLELHEVTHRLHLVNEEV